MMQKSRLLALFIVFSVAVCFSQSVSDLSSQGIPSQGTAADCSDPSQAGSVACRAAQAQRSGGSPGQKYPSPLLLPPQFESLGGFFPDQNLLAPPPLQPSQI